MVLMRRRRKKKERLPIRYADFIYHYFERFFVSVVFA